MLRSNPITFFDGNASTRLLFFHIALSFSAAPFYRVAPSFPQRNSASENVIPQSPKAKDSHPSVSSHSPPSGLFGKKAAA